MEILSLQLAINSISVSPDAKLLICGGREILKIFKLENKITEDRSLRIGKPNLNYSTQDLAWHPRQSNYILSAAKNSCIVLWNLDKSGPNKLDLIFKGHSKVVNRVKWQHTNYDVFVSAGQDGMIKLWDKRVADQVILNLQGNAEGARDVSFSPFKENLIAASFDNGQVQIWDLKMPNPLCKIGAHKRNALSIDWHPNYADLLASAGSDKNIKVWNAQSSELVCKVQAPEPVAKVSWVPHENNQIASASHTLDNNLYIWHLNEPSLPHFVYRGHAHPIKDFLWVGDSIITCSEDGNLIRNPRENAYRPHKYLAKHSLAVSPLNVLATYSDSQTPSNPDELLSQADRSLIHHTSKMKIYDLGDYKTEIENLASSYQLKGKNVEQLCKENAAVSRKKAPIWNSVEHLFKSSYSVDYPWINTIILNALQETIDYYSEIGDVQTAACLSAVFNYRGPVREYGDLLRQLNLHHEATKLDIPQPNVEIFLRCKCGKISEDQPCSKCKDISNCAVCNLPVKGLYSWCQGCCHGGHLMHLKNWFSRETLCPAGCGHQCSFENF
ncbi:unnamed protein product [Blepharisma stoltei]|uniref:WDR59/RTC1-like RING zinc finger domain-containing protein n=1 Tax=Blepharisma stoltei TaxID=1481888 RepID=A0AAU9JMZ6_9CILI|nr:unnamed protein product [Blepharisma stoltei]